MTTEITIVSLIIIMTLSLYSIKKYKDKSMGDKYISVICAIVGAIAAVMNIGNKVTVGQDSFSSVDILCLSLVQ